MANNKVTKDKIAKQALDEISFARRYKQGKIEGWQLNESLYYSNMPTSEDSRANVDLARMQEFVHTILSKIDSPLTFEFIKRKSSQLKRVEFLNSLMTLDKERDNWDIKDIVGKKQALLYGRAIYSYYADSIDKKYKPHLENIDVYDFLIDPSAGGIDIENASYLGDHSVILSKKQLLAGAKAKIYNKKAVDELLAGSGNREESSKEELNKQSRQYDQKTINQGDIDDKTLYRFWRWFTTYQEDGERYYLLMNDSGMQIKCEKLIEVFPATDEFPLGAWPYWTWASYMDMTEFWSPGYCDYARQIFMAQSIAINQMLDNAEAINKPTRIIDASAIDNPEELKYRPDNVVFTKTGIDVNKAYQTVTVPSIDTPIEVYNILEGIVQRTSGVTDQVTGVADTQGRVAIYEGNQDATADRFGLLNKSYTFAYKRFARLYEAGVDGHLIEKIAIDLVGPSGIIVKEINSKDIFKDDEKFGLLIKASNADKLKSSREKTDKIKFLQSQANNENINQMVNFEMQAEIMGFKDDDIDRLTDVENYGNSALMSECDMDLEGLLKLKDVPLNQLANVKYKQKIVNYLKDQSNVLTKKQLFHIEKYVDGLEPIIMKNEAKKLNDEKTDLMNAQTDAMNGMALKGEEEEGLPMNNPSKQKTMELEAPEGEIL